MLDQETPFGADNIEVNFFLSCSLALFIRAVSRFGSLYLFLFIH
jgi:hypothetical protein